MLKISFKYMRFGTKLIRFCFYIDEVVRMYYNIKGIVLIKSNNSIVKYFNNVE